MQGMNLEQILQFTIAHNATIIEVLIAAILISVLFLSFRTFLFVSSAPEESNSSSMVELEATLKKLLEQAGKVPLTVAPENQAAGSAVQGAPATPSAEAAQLSEQINTLRKELEVKQKEIEQIKSSGGAGATAAPSPGMSTEDKAKLEAQIKDLQAKLQEYEIISEDIADLSFYKEQNAKLQKELEGVKGGNPLAGEALSGVPAPEAQPAAAVTEAQSTEAPAEAVAKEAEAEPPKPKEEPAIVGKSSTSVETAPEAAPAPAAEPAPEPPVENVVDDALLAEFADAVKNQKIETAVATPVEGAPAAAPTPAAPAAKAEESVLGEVNIEKMVQEAGGISTEGPEVSAEQALGSALDADKLLQEADAMKTVNAEEKKLMGDFENFVKKNEAKT